MPYFPGTILLLVFLLSSLVVYGVWGIYVFFAAVMAEIYLLKGRVLKCAISLLIGLVFLPFLYVGIYPADGSARAIPIEQYRCSFRLKSIACALSNYESKHGCYPPAHIADDTGKPMHSWRVLILPYLDGDQNIRLYEQYNFDEPWDGPNNRKLFSACPELYICREAVTGSKPERSNTSYVAVVGENAAWPVKGSPSQKDEKRREHTSTTIGLIEVSSAAGIKWTEPRDFSLDGLNASHTVGDTHVLHQRTSKGNFFFDYEVTGPPRASVAFINGSVDSLAAENLTPNRLAELLVIGGCNMDVDCGPSKSAAKVGSRIKLKWLNCSALAVWLVSFGLLLYYALHGRGAVKTLTAVFAEPNGAASETGKE